MKNNNICFIITKSEVGGAQKWVKEQIDILSNNGFSCFICTNQEGWITEQSKSINNLTDQRIEKRTSLGFLFKLNSFIRNNKIDLIIGSSANGGIYSRLSATLTKRKCIYVSHGWSSVYNGGKLAFLFNWIERFLSTISDKILCVSNNDLNIALKKIKINEQKLITIPNKILPIKTVENKTFQSENKLNKTRILFLGRLAPPKTPIPLIDALKNKFNYQLDIVGSGPDMDAIQSYIDEEHIQNVILKGEIKNFISFNEYDIFCLISKSEGLPLSAVEALSCGLPILISNVGGCPDLIDKNGYLTDNSPQDILSGIKLIEKQKEEFAENSVKLYNTRFNLKQNFQEYIDLYENL